MKLFTLGFIALLAVPSMSLAQADESGIRVALVKMPFRGARNVPEISIVPDYLENGGIADSLRRLGDRTQQRDVSGGMTATAERRLSPHGPALRGPLTKFRYIGWNADIGSRLPDPQGKLGLATAVDQFQTQLVAYGAQIDLRFLLGQIVEEIPQCRCIAFYDFAQTITDGFEQVVT